MIYSDSNKKLKRYTDMNLFHGLVSTNLNNSDITLVFNNTHLQLH